MNFFLVFRDGVQVGRFSSDQLRTMARARELLGTDELQQVGSSKRRRADQIAGLGLTAPAPQVRQRSAAAPPAAPVPTFTPAPVQAPSAGPVEQEPFVVVTNSHAPAGPNPRSASTAKSASGILPLVAVLGGLLLVAGIGVGGLLLFASPLSPFSDRYVKLVRNGRLEGCPHRTIDEMTSGFLTRPRWKSLVADDGNRYVNCSGGLTFRDAPATAELQFAIIGQSGFRLRSLEINGDPQPLLVQAVLLKKMCEE